MLFVTRSEFNNIILMPFQFTDQPDHIIMTAQIKSATVIDEIIIQNWQAAGLLKP